MISGLARGIDAAAHAGALETGCTVAVLGGGLDRIYPSEHEPLARRIEERGALLSEFPPGVAPLPFHFPRRNRLISGLAEVTLVVEAREKSGTLITVDCALAQGREAMAVPGPINSPRSVGCNRLIQHGAKPVTLSDSSGFIHDPDGFDKKKLAWIKNLKEVKRGRIKEYADKYGVDYFPGQRPWSIPCDLAFPCATQNEVNREDAEMLVQNGCIGVSEGANMPSDPDAIEIFINARILYGPGKAANAGGVAISGLEMSQNSLRMSWSRKELNKHLGDIMLSIHESCVKHGTDPDGYVNYPRGANIAGFKKVAKALLA